MEKSCEWDVFVSHNWKQKPWVREVVTQWQHLGLKVFFDEKDIKPGDDILQVLDKGLKGSRCVVLIITPESVASKWVAMESAATLYQHLSGEESRLIPVMLEPTIKAEIPLAVRSLSMVDLTDASARRHSYHTLLYALGVSEDRDLPDPPAGKAGEEEDDHNNDSDSIDVLSVLKLIKDTFVTSDKLRQEHVDGLAKLAYKSWELIAKVSDQSEMSLIIEEMLWKFYVQLSTFGALFLAEHGGQSIAEQKKAVYHIYFNRGSGDEADRILKHLATSSLQPREITELAKKLLETMP